MSEVGRELCDDGGSLSANRASFRMLSIELGLGRRGFPGSEMRSPKSSWNSRLRSSSWCVRAKLETELRLNGGLRSSELCVSGVDVNREDRTPGQLLSSFHCLNQSFFASFPVGSVLQVLSPAFEAHISSRFFLLAGSSFWELSFQIPFSRLSFQLSVDWEGSFQILESPFSKFCKIGGDFDERTSVFVFHRPRLSPSLDGNSLCRKSFKNSSVFAPDHS